MIIDFFSNNLIKSTCYQAACKYISTLLSKLTIDSDYKLQVKKKN